MDGSPLRSSGLSGGAHSSNGASFSGTASSDNNGTGISNGGSTTTATIGGNNNMASASKGFLPTPRDLASFDSPLTGRARPTSEIFLQAPSRTGGDDSVDNAAEQWLADLENYQVTLQQMAEVQLDNNFKDELSAVEQWFQVLGEEERTAALYSLLHLTTPIQIRFFITVLQQLANRDPISAAFSPTESSSQMYNHHVNGGGAGGVASNGVPHPSFIGSSSSGLSNTFGFMNNLNNFGAISGLNSNGNSNPNSSFISPAKDMAMLPSQRQIAPHTPWANEINRPKSATDIGPSYSSSLRNEITHATPNNSTPAGKTGASSGVPTTSSSVLSSSSSTVGNTSGITPRVNPLYGHNRSVSVIDDTIHSPIMNNNSTSMNYLPEGYTSWASAISTPISSNTSREKINAEILSTTAMKMAAFNTVNGRAQLDSEMRKYRRDNDEQHQQQQRMTTAANMSWTSGPGSPTFRGAGSTNGRHTRDMSSTNNSQLRLNSPTGANTSSQSMFGTPQHGASHSFTASLQSLSLNAGSGNANSSSISQANTSSGAVKKEVDFMSLALLEDIPSWLRALRLHKYTENLSDLKWKDLIKLTDDQLEERGVNALGARRKMLKMFEQINEAMEKDELQ